jgi:hypothetical protein
VRRPPFSIGRGKDTATHSLWARHFWQWTPHSLSHVQRATTQENVAIQQHPRLARWQVIFTTCGKINVMYFVYETLMQLHYHFQSTVEGVDMTAIGVTQVSDAERAEYRQRTVVNFVAATFVTFLMISGLWIVSTLAG